MVNERNTWLLYKLYIYFSRCFGGELNHHQWHLYVNRCIIHFVTGGVNLNIDQKFLYGKNFPDQMNLTRSPAGWGSRSTFTEKSMALTTPSPNSSWTTSFKAGPYTHNACPIFEIFSKSKHNIFLKYIILPHAFDTVRDRMGFCHLLDSCEV